MILRDWRHADTARLRACYEAEARSWEEDLGWDTTWTWATVEEARVTWGLPGLLVEDAAGVVQGWAFWMAEGPTLHVGGLVASSPAVTAVLLDGIVTRAQDAGAIACFVRDRAPGLTDFLATRGFSHERFLYLSRALPSMAGPSATSGEPWNEADFPGAVALMQSAYTGGGGRHFAPNGTATEWTRYLSELVAHRGCGEFDAVTTRVVRDSGGLAAVALMTALSPRTAHLAQLVVRPECRGRGLAARLVAQVLDAAARTGKTAVTLLVGEANGAARSLYAKAGFDQQGTFIAGRCELAVGV